MLKSSVFANGKPVKWSSKCFGSNVATAKYNADKTAVEISVTSSDPQLADGEKICEDAYMIGTAPHTNWFNSIIAEPVKPIVSSSFTLNLPADVTAAEYWDIDNKGKSRHTHSLSLYL
jgi:hypothetical protein